jgi:low affinity Fe/Cu permease
VFQQWFRKFAQAASDVAGTAYAFVLAVVVVLAWLVTGPLFGFSQTWQLLINTGTTIVTFLMVFVLQSSQNRDTRAIHRKLDELIEGEPGAQDDVAGIEEADRDAVERIHRRQERRKQAAGRSGVEQTSH